MTSATMGVSLSPSSWRTASASDGSKGLPCRSSASRPCFCSVPISADQMTGPAGGERSARDEAHAARGGSEADDEPAEAHAARGGSEADDEPAEAHAARGGSEADDEPAEAHAARAGSEADDEPADHTV